LALDAAMMGKQGACYAKQTKDLEAKDECQASAHGDLGQGLRGSTSRFPASDLLSHPETLKLP
jgi:hypothetical protein